MQKRPFDENEITQMFALRDANFTSAEIAQQLGRTKPSIDGKFRQLRLRKYSAADPPRPGPTDHESPVVKFENAALQAETEKLKSELDGLRANRSAAGVTSENTADQQADEAENWEQTKKHNRKKIEQVNTSNRFNVQFPDDVTVICFISDTHIARGACDFERMQQDAETIRKYNWNAILLGDMVDNGIRHRSMMIKSRSNPSEEYSLFNYWLQMFGADAKGITNVLLMISGNHDAWTVAHAGVDMLQEIALQNRIAYNPAGARLDVKVGEIDYRIIARHQYRYHSHFNQLHSAKRLYDMGDDGDPSIIAIGHNHQCGIEQFWRHGRPVWGCRPGSYQISTDYSRQYGFPASAPTCPTFFLMPKEKKVIGFSDIRDAVFCWEKMR